MDIKNGSSVSSNILKGAAPLFLHRGNTGCLLLHGFTSSPTEFSELAHRLADNNVTVSVPLLPGHGTSPEHLNQTHALEFTDAAIAAFNELESRCGRIFIIGSSFGAILAMHLVFARPAAGLILVSPLIRIRRSPHSLIPPELAVRWFGGILRYRKKEEIASTNDKSMIKTHAAYKTIPLKGLGEALKIVNGIRNRMAEIQCPVLLFHSLNDTVADLCGAKELKAAYRGRILESYWLERSNHVLMLDYDREFIIRKILDFIVRFSAD